MVDKELLQAIGELLDAKLDAKLEPIKQDLNSLKIDNIVVKQEIRNVKLTLENETNVGINIIGEGYAILNRRLDEALKVTSEQELLLLRVTHLENELRRIKEQLQSNIA